MRRFVVLRSIEVWELSLLLLLLLLLLKFGGGQETVRVIETFRPNFLTRLLETFDQSPQLERTQSKVSKNLVKSGHVCLCSMITHLIK